MSARFGSTQAPVVYAFANRHAASDPTLKAGFPRAPIESAPMKQESPTALTSIELPGDCDSSMWTLTAAAERPYLASCDRAEETCCSGTRFGNMPALLTSVIGGSESLLERSIGLTPRQGSMRILA